MTLRQVGEYRILYCFDCTADIRSVSPPSIRSGFRACPVCGSDRVLVGAQFSDHGRPVITVDESRPVRLLDPMFRLGDLCHEGKRGDRAGVPKDLRTVWNRTDQEYGLQIALMVGNVALWFAQMGVDWDSAWDMARATLWTLAQR